MMIQVRIHRFHELIKKKPDSKSFAIALKLGLIDEINLNKYLKRYTRQPPSYWIEKMGSENGN